MDGEAPVIAPEIFDDEPAYGIQYPISPENLTVKDFTFTEKKQNPKNYERVQGKINLCGV